ncbi:hypothetical protein Tco_0575229 [Tanacetum coccineum]
MAKNTTIYPKAEESIVTSSGPTYDLEPDTVTEDDEMSKEKEIDKLMALTSLSFKKIYKPTNNNLRTSSNTSRANQDNSLRINKGIGYDNQRAVNVAGARENISTLIVQKSGIQSYHKEKMLLCKQEEAGVQLNAEQADWKDDTDDESDDQELEAHYMYMVQLQKVTPDQVDNSGPIFDDELMHKVQNNNDNYNVFAMENEHPEQPESSNHIYLAKQGDTNITIDSLDNCKEKIKNDKSFNENQSNIFLKEREQYFEIQDLKTQLQDKGIAISELKKLIEKMKGKSVETKFENSSIIRQPNAFKNQRQSILVSAQILPQKVLPVLKNTNVIAPGMYKVHTKPNQTRTPQLPQDIRKTNKCMSLSTRVIPATSVSRPQLKSNQLEDRVMSINSQGKKQEVEDQP